MSINVTELQLFEREILESPRTAHTVQLRLYDVLIPILGAIIITTNGLVVISSGLILRKRQQPRSTYIFLGNIALADMLTGAATLFGQYYPKAHRTEMICCINIGMIVAATLASVYSIGLIAIDRFFYILFGLQYQRFLASKRARCMVLGTWLLALFIGFLPAMGIRNPTESKKFCWLIILEPTGLILTTVSIGIAPLIMITVLYSIILKKALGKISEMRQNETAPRLTGANETSGLRYFRGGSGSGKANGAFENSTADRVSYIAEDTVSEMQPTSRSVLNCCRKSNTVKISSVYSPSRWKAIKIVVFTTGCFFVTWFPYFFACGLYALCDPDNNPQYCDNLRVAIASPLAILGLLNSLLNPIIYAWWHNGFRTTAKRIFNGIWNRNVKPKIETLQRARKSVETSGSTQRKISESTDVEPQKSNSTENTDIDAPALEKIAVSETRSNSVVLGVLEPLQKRI